MQRDIGREIVLVSGLLSFSARATGSEREAEITALAPWFHNIHLPDGSQTAPDTPLGDFPRRKWNQLAPALPQDLTGWSVLDIGCNAGFYSIELARRGAFVTAIDVEPHFLRQTEWVVQQFGLEGCVELRRMQVYDLQHVDEQFDLVLFMGVFYHLRYPTLALDIVAARVRRLLVFQSLTMPGDEVLSADVAQLDISDREIFTRPGWPKLAFMEGAYAGDRSNWWAPNHAAIEALLRSSGMRVLARPGHEIYLAQPDPDRPGWAVTEGRAELLAATGRPWNGPTALPERQHAASAESA